MCEEPSGSAGGRRRQSGLKVNVSRDGQRSRMVGRSSMERVLRSRKSRLEP